MKRLPLLGILAIAAAVLLAGCGSTVKIRADHAGPPRLAVVSFVVANRVFREPDPIRPQIDGLLSELESSLGKYGEVIPARSIVGLDALDGFKSPAGIYLTPLFGGRTLPVFSENHLAILRGELPAETARRLCETTGADAVVLVASEWARQMVRYSRVAFTKNALTAYDRRGNRIVFDYLTDQGREPVGSPVHTVEDDYTRQEWVKSYRRGMEKLLARNFRPWQP